MIGCCEGSSRETLGKRQSRLALWRGKERKSFFGTVSARTCLGSKDGEAMMKATARKKTMGERTFDHQADGHVYKSR